MATPSSGNCTICEQNTTKRCTGCVEGVDSNGEPISPTFYCSKNCQKADFAKHKVPCQNARTRQQLYRGGELLQEAFYAFREAAFDLNIQNVRMNEGTLVIDEAPYFQGQWPLYPFPDHLVSDSNDKKAILAFMACREAHKSMFELTKKALKGILHATKPPTELLTRLKQPRPVVERSCTKPYLNDSDIFHTGLVIPLKNGQTFAMDLAGAQYRQYQTILPLQKYADLSLQVATEDPFGTEASRPFTQTSTPGLCLEERQYLISQEITKALNKSVETWESTARKTVNQMLTQKRAEFEVDKSALLATIQRSMQARIQELQSG